MIELRHCVFETTSWGCRTRFADGSESSNWPLGDDAFVRLAAACGSDALTYVREHDLCHSLLAERMFDRPSRTLWAAAHGTKSIESDWEEKMVYYFQRFVHGKARAPDLDWCEWKQQVLRIRCGIANLTRREA